MKLEKILSLIVALSHVMTKVVLPDIVMYARKTFVVAWSDIFQELVDLIYKGYDLSKVKRRIRALVKAVRERADYMLNHAWEFDGLTTAAEAAEHLNMFALTKLGMIPANQDPQLLIRAAITTEKIKDIISTREEGDLVGGDHLLDALINAGTPTTIDGQDPIPPIINFAELLLDESRALDRVIERARAWTRDPEWIAEIAILHAYWEVQDEMKPVEVSNGKCDHCFALSDEQYYKQLETTPHMRYDQDMYHGVTWLEAFIRFEIRSACSIASGPRKQPSPTKHRRWFILEIPKQMEDNKDVTKNR